jgi:trehalose 6-phosphate synthase
MQTVFDKVGFLSHRGFPEDGQVLPGGVCAGLFRIFQKLKNPYWFFMRGNALMVAFRLDGVVTIVEINVYDADLVARHYKYCVRYLWAIMHSMSAEGEYLEGDHQAYLELNRAVATDVAEYMRNNDITLNFVQDYQWALVPKYILDCFRTAVVKMFWHIPFPPPESLGYGDIVPLAEVAEAMLGAETLGVHTPEYQTNFLAFVGKALRGFNANKILGTVAATDPEWQTGAANTCEIVVCPLGVDYGWWSATSKEPEPMLATIPDCTPRPITVMPKGNEVLIRPDGAILTCRKLRKDDPGDRYQAEDIYIIVPPDVDVATLVARRDYTKAIPEAVDGIEGSFVNNPLAYMGKVTYYLVVTPTRDGVDAFEKYGLKVDHRIEGNDDPLKGPVQEGAIRRIQRLWDEVPDLRGKRRDDWTPIVYQKHLISPEVLAKLYRRSRVVIVAPRKDGLNLTAYEAIAAQSMKRPGVIILSRGAGAFVQLGEHCVGVDLDDIPGYAQTLHQAMELATKRPDLAAARLGPAKNAVRDADIDHWFSRFSQRARMGLNGGGMDEDDEQG